MHQPANAATDIVLPLPPQVPRVRPNRFVRWFARSLLRLGGWRMAGQFPDLPKVVLIGAPHSSNWDGIWGLLVKVAMGLDIKLLGKDALFKVPLMGPILHKMGVIPVDRSAAHGVVEQAAAMIRGADRLWFGLAPEGTRKVVEKWKPGFWRIAKLAGVPVLPAYFHYRDKVIGIGPVFELGDDVEADIARIRAWYRAVANGKHHEA